MATTKAAKEEEFDYDAYMEEKVTVRLPIVPGKEKQEAQFVGVNGRDWVIPRGQDFQVPRYVVEVLQNSENEQLRAVEYREGKKYRR